MRLPLAALLWEAKNRRPWSGFWQAISNPDAVEALKLTFGAAFIVVLISAVLGTITACQVLVRDDFRGKSRSSTPSSRPAAFALPTAIVMPA